MCILKWTQSREFIKEQPMYVPGKKEAWLAVVTLIVLAVLLASGSL